MIIEHVVLETPRDMFLFYNNLVHNNLLYSEMSGEDDICCFTTTPGNERYLAERRPLNEIQKPQRYIVNG